MKKSFVRVVSLVGALALPAGLIAQANPSKTTTSTEKSTTKMETKTTEKGTAKTSTKKRRHHHKKTTKTQAAKPSTK
jgi:hypothetical protein